MAQRSPDAPSSRADQPPPSAAALFFLRGRDADRRVQALVAERHGLRPLLAGLSVALLRRHAFEPLGFRGLGDYARERLGVTARAVREWARVWEALGDLPCLRAAVLAGEVSWSVARRIVGHVSPETDAACVETVRGRTVRAVEALLRAAFGEPAPEITEPGDRVRVHVPLAPAAIARWHAALELARRMAGEAFPVWECAESIAAEALGALPVEVVARVAAAQAVPPGATLKRGPAAAGAERPGQDREHGLRHRAFPHLRWDVRNEETPLPDLETLAAWTLRASPHTLDAALRRAVHRLQAIDADLGLILRQILDRKLYRELGFLSFDRYAEERADLSARTARRRVRLARLGAAHPAAATAFREGTLTERQTELVAQASGPDASGAWVTFAQGVTLRRLEEEAGPAGTTAGGVTFYAPPDAASVFLLAVAAARVQPADAAGRPASSVHALAWMLEHVIAAWIEQGAAFKDYADFNRDHYRCTAPGCTARRSLQSHPIVRRSAGGPDEPWNRTTLCAFHHLRGIHAGLVHCTGRAPEGLVFELGVRNGAPPLLRARSGDLLLGRGSLGATTAHALQPAR